MELPAGVTLGHDQHGLDVINVKTALCSAVVYIQGAHLAEWTPSGQRAVLWMSPGSIYEKGKPLRGGIPIVFPWFAQQPGLSMHGYARIENWKLVKAELDTDGAVHLTLELPSNAYAGEVARAGDADASARAAGYEGVGLEAEFVLGSVLQVFLTVTNGRANEIKYEEAFHTYFAVEDVAAVSIGGLAGAGYIDNTKGGARAVQEAEILKCVGETGRVYVGNQADVVVEDAGRKVWIGKRGSRTTVVWNAGKEVLPELPGDCWRKYLCVEAGNAKDDAVVLGPGAMHVLELCVAVE